MPSYESRLVIRRGPNVAPSHPSRVALLAILTFTTKKWLTFEPDPNDVNLKEGTFYPDVYVTRYAYRYL